MHREKDIIVLSPPIDPTASTQTLLSSDTPTDITGTTVEHVDPSAVSQQSNEYHTQRAQNPDIIAALPVAIQQINDLLARLPPGRAGGAPPLYDD